MRSWSRSINEDFRCIHCRRIVPAATFVSGVVNRNHCPYCLWSRHVDFARPGDRLAACKEKMRPVGVTLKRTPKKYARPYAGELMLIHRCEACGKVSLNRIAADDIPEAVYEVYAGSLRMEAPARRELEAGGIEILQAEHLAVVRARLFGGGVAAGNWAENPWAA